MSTPYTPAGAKFLGRGELTKGRGWLEYLDLTTESNFTVPEAMATNQEIERVQREHRANFRSAGSAFAPPVI